MLSLAKKSDEPVVAPRWHPNFRNFERLPDTKVVRTAFFINTAAIAVAAGMLLWVGYKEYTNHSIREQIARAEADIEANKKQNAEATRLSKLFVEQAKKLEEAEAFVAVPITPFEYVTILGQTVPKEIQIDYLDTRLSDPGRPAQFQLRGRVAGSPDQASGVASNYVDMLRAHPRFGEVFESINLNRINRDSSGLVFEIALTVKSAAKGKK
jgi:hypothetical protein